VKAVSRKRRNSRTIHKAWLRSVFFGGRYEETRIGSSHVIHYDISSAYPALPTLPTKVAP
jgi:hypothetical protein